jgi:hypothetical protein
MDSTRRTIYLSGALSGCNQTRKRVWRQEFMRACPRFFYVDPTTRGDERALAHAGKVYIMEKHVAFGVGDASHLLRIHSIVDDDGRFVVGHCGRHLTNTKS